MNTRLLMNTRSPLTHWNPLALSVAVLFLFGGLAAAQEESEASWPRQLDGELGQIVIYQPQLESYSGNYLKARAAVSVTPTGQTEPVFGAMWFDAELVTDMDTRMASLESIEVTATRFPDAGRDQT
jgi:hypothetical protein